jgi:hypothetical protein
MPSVSHQIEEGGGALLADLDPGIGAEGERPAVIDEALAVVGSDVLEASVLVLCRLPAVLCGQLGASEDVAIDGGLYQRTGGASGHVELGVESVEGEDIAMRFAGWRAGAAVANLAEVAFALPGAVRKLSLLRDACRKFGCRCGEVVEHPVGEGAAWCVRIRDGEGDGLGSVRSCLPGQGRRLVFSIAGELPGHAAVPKAGTRER